ncbi:AMP-binding protein [Streptomonospora sp. S1-112]|uniref:AMP-binding protein n=1 Tax=Streptomonospora mangrovi TaxID=2883123 RepID=A0A9X3NR65_9ACTN|nr:AMP-binding protein [Streptomonospora mangrovi]MDA0567857.1 AMP-binding protein [Streptomonospora mangrovi]
MRHRRRDPLFADPPLAGLAELPLQDSVAGFARPAGEGWQRVSAADFRRDVAAAAKGLAATGLERGDRLVLACGTRYEWAVIAFATWAMGAVLVPLHPALSQARLRHVLADVRADAIVVENPAHAPVVAEARRMLPGLVRTWWIDGPPSRGEADRAGGPPATALHEITAAGVYMDHSVVANRSATVGPQDIAVLSYPVLGQRVHGAAITHGNLIYSAAAQVETVRPLLDEIPEGEADTLLHLPLAGVAAQNLLVACMMAGVRVAFPARGGTRAPLRQTRAYGPTIVIARAGHLERAYTQERAAEHARPDQPGWDRKKAFDAAVEHAVKIGKGAKRGRPGVFGRVSHAMHEWLYTQFRDRFGSRARVIICAGRPSDRMRWFFSGAGMRVVEGFGIAETSGPLALRLPGPDPDGAAGFPLPGTELRDGPGGEVEARGTTVFRGYWNTPDSATTPTHFADGWLRTGLLGRLCRDGSVEITGRVARVPPPLPPGAPPPQQITPAAPQTPPPYTAPPRHAPAGPPPHGQQGAPPHPPHTPYAAPAPHHLPPAAPPHATAAPQVPPAPPAAAPADEPPTVPWHRTQGAER